MNNCPKCGAEMVSRICPLCGFYVSPSSDKNAENTGAQNGGGAAVGYTGSSMFKDCGRKASANGSNTSGSNTSGSNANGSNASGSSANGSSASGSNTNGSSTSGSGANGSNASGSGASGSNASGSNTSGSNASGSNTSGSNAGGANKKRRCPKCGREVTSRFCPDCGCDTSNKPKCPKCGAEMLSRYCPECGYDRDSKKANENAAMLAIFKRKEKIKKIATISIMLVLCITVAIIVAVNLASPFRMGKVSKVTIGMSQAKVEKILGEPTVIDEDDYYWYSGKVAKKVEKAESKLEESFMSGDGEDMDAAIEEYDKAYAEIADMTYKFIKVDFDSDDKVSEIFFDKKHKYSEDDDYSTDKKTVKEASLALGAADAYDIDDRVVMAQEMDEIVYCVKFSDGSYYSSTVYASDLSNDDIKRTEKGHSTVYRWSDHHGLGEYSAEKSVNILCSVKDGVLKNWYSEQEEITLPSAAKRIGDYSIGNNAVKTINIHSGVSNIDKNAFSGCVQLATINYDGTIEQWEATYGKNGSHLNGSDVGSYRVICTNGKTCMACDARGHEMRVATCFLPSTCKNCDYTHGDALGHAWESATCVNPRTCSRCQKTEGAAIGHNWYDDICTMCGKKSRARD